MKGIPSAEGSSPAAGAGLRQPAGAALTGLTPPCTPRRSVRPPPGPFAAFRRCAFVGVCDHLARMASATRKDAGAKAHHPSAEAVLPRATPRQRGSVVERLMGARFPASALTGVRGGRARLIPPSGGRIAGAPHALFTRGAVRPPEGERILHDRR